MKKKEILYVLLAIFFIGCSPGEFNPNVNITIDGNESKEPLTATDDNQSENLPVETDGSEPEPVPETNTTCKSLPKTGQNKVHYINDDGDLQKGVTRSYTRDNQKQIVTDNNMGLMWQDSENIKKPWVIQENYASGNYANTNGDTATTYCENLKLGGYEGWRLPTSDELYYLVDRGKERASIDSAFKNATFFGVSYWSSTASKNSAKAWSISFDDGYGRDENKNSNFFVRCVRGENKITHNFVRDPVKKIVNDTKTCLMWQDDTSVISMDLVLWEEAINHCNNLDFAGFDNWRTPNINELNSIRDTDSDGLIIREAFVNTSTDGYWSSTSQAIWSSFAWTIYFDNGYTSDDNKLSHAYRVRCVRSGE